ncbi:hypothetical protein Zmor_016284 [Zophobas morio]|uniref:Proteasome subunit beta n=1 Tax=Zophobas morio TaxID=2755281 RepID=A0AA38HGZ8_9CUCU|nr:hypothetical protein Zmor_016284 [Zophobas morio]
MDYNGAALVAMVGKECVAIASDTRLGVQFQTVSTKFQKIFQMGKRLMLGLAGLATDVQTMKERIDFRLKLYTLRENREIKPKAFMNLVSSMLYEKRLQTTFYTSFALFLLFSRFGPYFINPVIAGLDNEGKPFISTADLIGCSTESTSFVVSGTCSENLYGMCESLWEPDLVPFKLFFTAGIVEVVSNVHV